MIFSMIVSDVIKNFKINSQLESFKDIKKLFGIEAVETTKDFFKKKNHSSVVRFLWG